MANRMLQDGSDARLEAMFADSPAEEEGALPHTIGQVNSWDDGAAEVADMIGAEVCCAYRWRLLPVYSEGCVVSVLCSLIRQ